ncbi:copper chaperone PCu(A)C [Actinoplanes sp. NPDC024001]|uniref:copper chaperone PCu(A)C n=1 Tax=Actinoplanes sp. NPDC024001 TaxID=3154598 RepID=UPI0033C1E1F2
MTIAAILLMVSLSACRIEDPRGIAGDQPEPFQESVMGTNAEIGPILLRSVHVEAPPDPSYQTGDDAILWFTALNEGRQEDTLTELSSPVADAVVIRHDDDCDGHAEPVPALPLRPVEPHPNASSDGVSPFAAYHGQVVDLNRQVMAGTTIPVTFVFERAGPITVDAFVQPSTAPRPAPSGLCHGSSAAAATAPTVQ